MNQNYCLPLIREAKNLLADLERESGWIGRGGKDDIAVCEHLQHLKQRIADARLIASRSGVVKGEIHA